MYERILKQNMRRAIIISLMTENLQKRRKNNKLLLNTVTAQVMKKWAFKYMTVHWFIIQLSGEL